MPQRRSTPSLARDDETRSHLAAILASSLDAIVMIDADGNIIEFNPAAERIFEISREEAIGREMVETIVPPAFRKRHRQSLAQYLASGKSGVLKQRTEMVGRRASGEEFPVEVTVTSSIAKGTPTFTGFVRDITERKRAEAEAHANRERLRIALDNGRVGLWDWDNENDTLEFSPQWKSQLGYEAHEISDSIEAWQNLLHPEDLQDALARVRALLEPETSSYSNEFRMRHKDGSYRWILSQGTVFRRNDGRAYRLMGTHVDITDLKNIEFDLIHSQEELQRAHHDLEVRVRLRTAQLAEANRVLRANEARLLKANRIVTELARLRVEDSEELRAAFQRITASTCELLDVARCSVWLFNDDRTAIRCLDLHECKQGRHSQGQVLPVQEYPEYFRTLESGRIIVADNAHTHPATHEFADSYLMPHGIASMLDTTISFGGQVAGVLCCEHVGSPRAWKVEEQTFASSAAALCSLALESHERARAEADLRGAKDEAEAARQNAERANRAKSEFLSRMSHELRTPLNAILGFGQVLQRQDLTPTQNERTSHILKAGHHLLALINEVLDIARVEAGGMEMSVEAVAVGQVVSETLDMVRPLAEQNQVQIENSISLQDPAHILADRQRLRQVLINLLSNAIKYNHPGGTAGISFRENEEGRIRIEVRDTGIGIAPEDLPRLFTPFERLGAGLTQVEGTGLGLALSHRLVEAMSGAMGVESTLAVGSTFFVELPGAPHPLDQMAKERGNEELRLEIGLANQWHTILSIEDNLSNQSLIEAILEDRPNVKLMGAMQGSVGLDLACRHHPDLILLDLHLPDTTGVELLRRLRETEETQRIPVVICSADATPTQIERLLAMGASAYLTKPIDVSQFLRVLDQTLRENDS